MDAVVADAGAAQCGLIITSAVNADKFIANIFKCGMVIVEVVVAGMFIADTFMVTG
jgi:hypothetical protein